MADPTSEMEISLDDDRLITSKTTLGPLKIGDFVFIKDTGWYRVSEIKPADAGSVRLWRIK